MSFITIYITNESEATAEKIAEHLVSKGLVACANIYPIKSIYRWKGAIEKEMEWVALVKTTKEMWEKAKQEIESVHPYEVPCIMKTVVSANESYVQWIEKSVNPI